MLGLCAKAGKLIWGVPPVCRALRAPSPPRLVLYSHTASQNSKKRITDKCSYYRVPSAEIPISTEELAKYTGKSGAVAAVGITDEGLARAVLGLIAQAGKEQNINTNPTQDNAQAADSTIH